MARGGSGGATEFKFLNRALFPEGLDCDCLPYSRFVSNKLQIDFLQLVDESESVWIENLRAQIINI